MAEAKQETPKNIGDTLPLKDGTAIPCVGLGTFMRRRAYEPGTCVRMARTALECGYRQLDCAAMYGNEEAVGKGIKEAIANESNGLKREDIYVVTKLWNNGHEVDRVEKCCRTSLNKLGLDYIDLYLMHWPVCVQWIDGQPRAPLLEPQVPLIETYAAMEKLVDAGIVKSIGVCNCTPGELKKIIDGARIKPAVHQIELHPYFIQKELKEICDRESIVIQSYVPLANLNPGTPNNVTPLDDELIKKIGTKYKKTAAQVILRWHIQYGVIPIPKSSNDNRIKENGDIFDFELTDEEFSSITALNRDKRTTNPPFTGKPFWPREDHI